MRILRRGPSRIGGILNGAGPTSFFVFGKKHSHNQAFLLRVPPGPADLLVRSVRAYALFRSNGLLLECDTSPKAVRCVWFRVWKV